MLDQAKLIAHKASACKEGDTLKRQCRYYIDNVDCVFQRVYTELMIIFTRLQFKNDIIYDKQIKEKMLIQCTKYLTPHKVLESISTIWVVATLLNVLILLFFFIQGLVLN